MIELTELERAVVEAAVDHYLVRGLAYASRNACLSDQERLKITDKFLKAEGAEILAVSGLIAFRAAQAVSE